MLYPYETIDAIDLHNTTHSLAQQLKPRILTG